MTWRILAWTVVEVCVAIAIRQQQHARVLGVGRAYARAIGTGHHGDANSAAGEVDAMHRERVHALARVRRMFGAA